MMKRTALLLLASLSGCAGSATCDDGGCTDAATSCTTCDGGCVDLLNDSANCGACGRACTGRGVCVQGQCVLQHCPIDYVCTEPGNPCRVGSVACDWTCTGLHDLPDFTTCGRGNYCAHGECQTCTPSTPCWQPFAADACRARELDCATGQCVETGVDLPDGGACGAGLRCVEGACVAFASCREIQDGLPGFRAADDAYVVDFDGPGPRSPEPVACDFVTAGGGWTLWNSPLMDALPDNAAMPRCGPGVTHDCYAGLNAGRGSAPGLFFVERHGTSVRQLATVSPPNWVGRTGEVFDAGACGSGPECPLAGTGRCLYSQLSDAGCCTSPTSANFCVK